MVPLSVVPFVGAIFSGSVNSGAVLTTLDMLVRNAVRNVLNGIIGLGVTVTVSVRIHRKDCSRSDVW